jgi:hypothetical protein
LAGCFSFSQLERLGDIEQFLARNDVKSAAAAVLFGRTSLSVIETDWCLECFIGFFTSIGVLFFEDRGIGGLFPLFPA